MTGEYKSTLDSKGRMNIPIKLREEIGNDFVMTKTIGSPCLTVYGKEEWEKLKQTLNQQPSVKIQNLKRFLYASTFDVTADKQGRVSVPPQLREYAALTLDVVVLGLDKGTAEIWDKAKWQEYNEQLNAAELHDLAVELGI